jgi:hypothetical protein
MADINSTVPPTTEDVINNSLVTDGLSRKDDDKKATQREKERVKKARYRAKKRKEVTAVKKAEVKKEKKRPRLQKSIVADQFAVHLVYRYSLVNTYKAGSKAANTIVMGNPAYGNVCKKNTFELLKVEQDRFRENNYAPEWVIISRDDTALFDNDLRERLAGLPTYVHAVGNIGVTDVRKSGRFFSPADISTLRGSSLRSTNDDTLDWSFSKAPEFDNGTSWRVAMLTSMFVAVRGSTFMSIDFSDCANDYEDGVYHYIPEICMAVNKKGLHIGTVKTLCLQSDTISNHLSDESFLKDQQRFVLRWHDQLPLMV